MLKGKTAVVTGGSRGIGEAIAYKLASMGANIAVIYAGNASAAETVCEKCRQEYSVEAKAYRCNVADFSATKETVAKMKADFGTAQILVNNAGITRDGLLAMMKEEDFDKVISINLKGTFNLTKLVTPYMMKRREGRIVSISSVVGVMGNAGQSNYAASKAGIIGFTKSVAKELASRNILANCVAPGFIATDMTAVLNDKVKESINAQIPLKRMGTAEEIANAVYFLGGEENTYITGQTLNIDGGMI